MIKDRNLTPGTKLVARYKKAAYACEVVSRRGGKIGYRLMDGDRSLQKPVSSGDGHHRRMPATAGPSGAWRPRMPNLPRYRLRTRQCPQS